MELVRRSQGNRGQRAPLTQRSYHPRWCWSGSPVQYLAHLIHVLDVDQCLVWASLGVRLPVWVGFVVTAGVLFFFFFFFSFFFFFPFFREREREIRCDLGLFVNGYKFEFLIICYDFGFFLFLEGGELSPINCVKLAWSIGCDRIFYVNCFDSFFFFLESFNLWRSLLMIDLYH